MKLEIVTESRLTETSDVGELLRENLVQVVQDIVTAPPEAVSITGPIHREDGMKVGNWRYYA